MGFDIPPKVKWTFIICVIVGTLVITLVRIKVARGVKRRYLDRKRSGRPYYMERLIPSHVSDGIDGFLPHDFGGACEYPFWRDIALGLTADVGNDIERHLYWVDWCYCSGGYGDLKGVFASKEWREWIQKDYVAIVDKESMVVFNSAGLRRCDTTRYIGERFVAIKMSFLPRFYHR